MGKATKSESASWRTLASFWLFGLCNNLPHILMLSAAEDINKKGGEAAHQAHDNETCPLRHGVQHCGAEKSTGIILFADAFPSIIMKILVMFFAQNISYTVRHSTIVVIQVIAMILVAFSESYPLAVFAVALALCGVGLGESTFISFSSYFPRSTTVAWSSGTGAAGIVGSALYAALTEPHLVNLSPKNAILFMLIFTFTLGLTYWFLLDHPQNLYRVFQTKYRGSDGFMNLEVMREKPKSRETTFKEKMALIKPLLRYLIPVMIVYVAEYTINLGLIQLIVFDCSHGFNLSKTSQYRWFQTIYRIGAFASKSSLSLLDFPVWMLYIFPFLQILNAAIFFSETILLFMPHIMVAFGLILVAGLYGGSSMVKTVSHVHKIVEPDVKEFSLAVVATTNGMGVLFASFTGILFHNLICKVIG